jgi:cell division protein FtsI (penicillin-binding protein 3)
LENRKIILTRIYLVYIGMCVLSIAIVYKIFKIQVLEGDKWRKKAEEATFKYFDIEASRGNIYDANGNMLATSIPFYELGMDVNAPSITKEIFNKNIDSLALELASLFQDKTTKEYTKLLRKARKDKDRYIVLQKNVSYKDLQKIKQFPLLRKKSKGGLVYIQTNRRERPFQFLAARTIGYTREGVKPIGLEGAYDSSLTGTSGKRLMQKIAGGVWRPLNGDNEIDPKNGQDLYTTIDINIQDVAENALLKQLAKNDASYGTVILMEVATGNIKAIANLTKRDSGIYDESFNYAVASATEPGSTFKLASLLTALDDGYINLNSKIEVGNGTYTYYDRVMKDSHTPETSTLTAQRIFETSSNVGVSRIITKYYSKNPQKYINKLNSFGLNKPIGLSIPGEGIPRIKQTKDRDWYGTSLPWISIGYESLVTPLHTLTLYNAVANNGKMVKPKFVKEIKYNGITVKSFETEYINKQIASADAIQQARKMLEGVVLNGGGRNLANASFTIAGKTGTAQISRNGSYKKAGNVIYQASFVGYFPANKPLYSCIVIVNSPSNGIYYGNVVAGPIFKEIAEKVYSGNIDFQAPINNNKEILGKTASTQLLEVEEYNTIAKALNINTVNDNKKMIQFKRTDSLKTTLVENDIQLQLNKKTIPNLKGIGAREALYYLENAGITVKLIGKGQVKEQSIVQGKSFKKGDQLTLMLN